MSLGWAVLFAVACLWIGGAVGYILGGFLAWNRCRDEHYTVVRSVVPDGAAEKAAIDAEFRRLLLRDPRFGRGDAA